MGFKCPVCFEDFHHDKEAMKKHCKEKHDGLGLDIIEWLERTTSNKEEDKRK